MSESFHVVGVGRQISHTAVDDATAVAEATDGFRVRCRLRFRVVEDPEDPFEKQLPKFAPAQGRFSLGSSENFFGKIVGRLHSASLLAVLPSIPVEVGHNLDHQRTDNWVGRQR